jgi:uncharacterized protein
MKNEVKMKMKIIALEEHFQIAAIKKAVALDVPIYLHPSFPPKAVQDACYAGLDPAVSASFATAGWGWHLETGTHALHMILAGVFDLYPTLQLILGHWGEMIPFYLARFDEALNPTTNYLQRPVADYFLQQMYAIPSGLFTLPPFLTHLADYGSRSHHVFSRLSLYCG